MNKGFSMFLNLVFFSKNSKCLCCCLESKWVSLALNTILILDIWKSFIKLMRLLSEFLITIIAAIQKYNKPEHPEDPSDKSACRVHPPKRPESRELIITTFYYHRSSSGIKINFNLRIYQNNFVKLILKKIERHLLHDVLRGWTDSSDCQEHVVRHQEVLSQNLEKK